MKVTAVLTLINGVLIVLLVVAIAFFAASIQQNRIDVTRDACQSQNLHHDRTIKKLSDELKPFLKGGSKARRAQILAQQTDSIALINELQPRQDCDEVVKTLK